MRKVILLALGTLFLASGTALADSLDGRLALTGKGGAFIPLRSDFVSGTTGSKIGLATGGGLLLGFGKSLAAEIDVTHVPGMDVENAGSKVFEATLTDIALGMQYRIGADNRLVPFVGAGADFIQGSLKSVAGVSYDMDWTIGGHVNVGVDYFVTSAIAFTAEVRGVLAAKGDIKNASPNQYDPSSFIGTVGLRLILPKISHW